MFINIQQFDIVVFHWLNGWAFWKPWLDGVIVFRASYLGYFVVVALFLFGLFSFLPMFPRAVRARRKNWEMIFVALLAGGIARLGIVELIRLFWHRLRPFEVLQNVHQLLWHDHEASFPSGHATFFFAIAAVVGRYYPKTSILFYLAALNLSAARVMAGIHWPSDIIAGAIIGVATGLVTASLWRKYAKSKTAA